MTRPTLPRIRPRDLVALLAIVAGFVVQDPFDRFGYLMGVAWLAIVFGMYDLWVSLAPERIAEAQRERDAWRGMANRIETRLELDATAFERELAAVAAKTGIVPPPLSFNEQTRREIVAAGRTPIYCVCDVDGCWCTSWVAAEPGYPPPAIACPECAAGHHVLTPNGGRS